MSVKGACRQHTQILDIFKDKNHKIQLQYIRSILIMLYFLLFCISYCYSNCWDNYVSGEWLGLGWDSDGKGENPTQSEGLSDINGALNQ